jgi:phosphoribosyl-AMP cyclohydrolase / phosphoribosyl-ATP pyrophosphohydrolase
MEPPSPKFDQSGLVPCVIQDWRSGEVLTLAYMNEEALRLSRETGELHLFSRSRNELWHKGATSGNTQAVKALRFDCDNDAVLALVEPAGPACHTGSKSCFAPALWRTVLERVRDRPAGSYVASLAEAGVQRAAQKVGEEGVEVALSAVAADGRLAAEAADLIFHLYVLLALSGIDIAAVEDELTARRKG